MAVSGCNHNIDTATSYNNIGVAINSKSETNVITRYGHRWVILVQDHFPNVSMPGWSLPKATSRMARALRNSTNAASKSPLLSRAKPILL
mmetsp:Transcript_19747/g.35842  ORF Transcript_19747/g.35842 Transcript_19747/m.35842 type:complete len:90 (+) Transcript_19747:237-506(+)